MTQTPTETMEQLDDDLLYLLSFPDKTDRNREAIRLHGRLEQFSHELDALPDQQLAATLRVRLVAVTTGLLDAVFGITP